MFTGIVQAVAQIYKVYDSKGIRTIEVEFPSDFTQQLNVGASIAIDGVCLTVTDLISEQLIRFDVMLTSLEITTLSSLTKDQRVNAERAAKEGAEIGGHPLSGHVDFKTKLSQIRQDEDNYCIRFELPQPWRRYIFSKGYIAINGASLTIAEVDSDKQWFEVWLIPETRRMTTFESKRVGDWVNIEIERNTQVMVDTVREAVSEELAQIKPLVEALLQMQGLSVDEMAAKIQTVVNKSLEP